MSKLNVYSTKGVKKTGMDLPNDLNEEINMNLLAQAIRVYEDRMHPGLSKVKTRSEVVASKAKIYRQKGTGRARHGALSAPIFVGGGKAHGPKGVKRQLTLPKSMRDKALKIALNIKAKDGRLILVDGISDIKKTKDAAEMIKKIEAKEKIKPNSSFLFALSKKNKDTVLYLRNLPKVRTVPFESLNAYNVYFSQVVMVDKNAMGDSKGKSSSGRSGSASSTGNKKKSKNSKTSKKGKEK